MLLRAQEALDDPVLERVEGNHRQPTARPEDLERRRKRAAERVELVVDLALALRQATSNHPSYLEARGTWASLTAVSARSVQLERERFVRGKLRLASLGNQDEAQVQAAERRLLSLLGSVHPGAVEVCNDGINNDCDAATPDLADLDGDGHNCAADCDDSNPAIRPGVGEHCTDLIDNNCNGAIDVLRPDFGLVQFGSPMRYLANSVDPNLGQTWTAFAFAETVIFAVVQYSPNQKEKGKSNRGGQNIVI